MAAGSRAGVEVLASGLSKRFGAVEAVAGVAFNARPGRVAALLGANGSGKSTTLRMALGLVAPTAGTVTFDGVAYRDLPEPQRVVGAVIDVDGFNPGRSARGHLRVLSATAGAPRDRVDALLAEVGLDEVGGRLVSRLSTGMRQRLAIASALVGDPPVLVLDEPASGLDPAGLRWLHRLVKEWASEGRTVLLSGHHLADVESVADDVVMLVGGRVAREGPLASIVASDRRTTVRSSDPRALARALEAAGVASQPGDDDELRAEADANTVAEIANREGVVILSLSGERGLDAAYFDLHPGDGHGTGELEQP